VRELEAGMDSDEFTTWIALNNLRAREAREAERRRRAAGSGGGA
jgi:hypothetical protein